jgi:hypothetical protein
MTETIPHPSGTGVLPLGMGEHRGALILHAPAELDGGEIEISLGHDPGAERVCARVWPRHGGMGRRYAAVYPGLTVGRYTVWRDGSIPVVTVTITGGSLTNCQLPAHPPRTVSRAW